MASPISKKRTNRSGVLPTFLRNRDFISIWLSNCFLFTTFYALIATLPAFVIEALKGGKEHVGPVLTTFLIAAVLFRPLAGKWLDELGRKKILFVSLALFLTSTVMYLWVKSLVILLALRFIHGISFGMGSTATGAVAADIIPDNHKGEGIGYYALSYNLAMVIGPFLGLTLLSNYSFAVLFSVLSGISLLSFLLANRIRIPSKPSEVQTKKHKPFHWSNYIEAKSVPAAVTGFVLSFTFSGFLAFIPVYAKEIGLIQVSSYFFVVYAFMMILSRPITGKIFDRYSEHHVIYPCIILYVIGLICLSQAQSPFLFLTAAGIIGVGFGSLSPCLQSIAIKSASSHQKGLAIGTYLTFFDLGVGVGSSVLGIIAALTSYSVMYIISSVFVAISALIYYTLHHRKKDVEQHRNQVQLHS